MSEGFCSEYVLLWYFHHLSEECRPFVYGGCGGNQNRFSSRDECHSWCGMEKRGREQITSDKLWIICEDTVNANRQYSVYLYNSDQKCTLSQAQNPGDEASNPKQDDKTFVHNYVKCFFFVVVFVLLLFIYFTSCFFICCTNKALKIKTRMIK